MSLARRSTDAAIQIFERVFSTTTTINEEESTILKSSVATRLNETRQRINDNDTESEIADGNFHTIFVGFNSLISTIVQDNILHHFSSLEDNNSTTRTKSMKGHRSRQAAPIEVQESTSSEWNQCPPVSPVKRALDSRALKKKTVDGIGAPPLNDVVSDDENSDSTTGRKETKASEADISEDDSVSMKTDHISTARELFNMLVCFSQLKESTGVERAILSSLLAFGSRGGTSRLVNDLIMEVENQRSLISQLENLKEGPLRNLILDLAQLSPYLAQLQDAILNGFTTLDTSTYDSDEFWNTITAYMDKLHSVELLIMEDLESELFRQEGTVQYSVSGMRMLKNKRLLEYSLKSWIEPNNTVDLVSTIHKMPAEAIKSLILSALEERPSNNRPSAQHKDSTRNQYHQDDNEQLPPIAISTTSLAKEWDIDIYEIKFQKRIGRGSFATTYLASWNAGQQVAVKVASTTENGLEGWRTEVAALQKLHHPNVIRLLGSVEHKAPLTYCLVLEYCNAGDLATVLRYPTPRNFFFHVSCSLANAMLYLHKRHILHRDLKPGNVLCHGNVASGNFEVKITDFGVARELDEGPNKACLDQGVQTKMDSSSSLEHLTGETGTYRWMAPEVICHKPYSYPADVYSFSLMVWQFLTREDPFCPMSPTDAALRVAGEGLRPPIPEKTPTALSDLIKANWSEDPATRWGFEKILKTLNNIKRFLADEEKIWIEDPHGDPVYDPRPEKKDPTPKAKVVDNRKAKSKGEGSKFFVGLFGSKKKQQG